MNEEKNEKTNEDWFGDNYLKGELPNLDELDNTKKKKNKPFDLTEAFKNFKGKL